MSIKFGWYPTATVMAPKEVLKYAVVADKSGFNSVWLIDHIALCGAPPSNEKDLTPDVWIELALIAANTNKIRLGPGVTDPIRRHPAITAQMVATLDHMSRGRVNLGIGTGHSMNISPLGIDFVHSLQRLREAIELMKILWTTRVASYSGKFYKLDNLHSGMSSAIVQKPHPPIYIGSLCGRKTREFIGEVAQGFLPYLCPPRLYRRYVKDIERGAKRAGRSLKEIDACAFVNIALSTDYSRAKREAEVLKRSVAYKGVIHYSYLFEELGYEFVHEAEDVPFELIEELAAIGSAEDCIRKIEEYIEAGARNILIRKISPIDHEEIFKVFKEKVIPYFSD